MDFKAVFIFALVGILACVLLAMVAPSVAGIWQTHADARLTEAKTEFTDAQTDQIAVDGLRSALDRVGAMVADLLAELKEQRKLNQSTLREMATVIDGLVGFAKLMILGNFALMGVLVLTVIGSVVSLVILSRQRRPTTLLVLPQSPTYPWLPVGDTSIVPYQTQDAIQIVDVVGQEIIIE